MPDPLTLSPDTKKGKPSRPAQHPLTPDVGRCPLHAHAE